MAEEGEDGQEKTEDPSQRKLEKAAEEGRVLTSKDMFVFTGLFGTLLLMLTVPMFMQPALGAWGDLFRLKHGTDLAYYAGYNLAQVGKLTIISTLVIGFPLLIVTVLTQFAVGGKLNFAPKAMEFKGNRIDPIKGFQRMFSMKALVELVKASLKVVLLFGVAFFVLYFEAPRILQLPFRSLGQGVASAGSMFPLILGSMLIALAVIAIIDYLWQRHSHIKSLKMSRQDQKNEYKQTEGSPEVKAKIRRLQMESAMNASRQQAALDDVPDATAVITNPTHFAVALRYEVGSPDAPVVLAMGRGKMAELIIERAHKAKVTVFQSPLLARALFFSSEIGKEISEKLYQAVAVVLAYIYRLDQGENLDLPNVELPQDMRFDEHGKPLIAEA